MYMDKISHHTYIILFMTCLRGHLTELTIACSICQPIHNIAIEHTVWGHT